MKEHDTIARRLILILIKLNSGDRFSIDELSEEFNVSTRTIQRDLNDRLATLPIKKENGYYYLEAYALGKLSFSDIKYFASISGIQSLYPSLSNNFIVDVLNPQINLAYLVKAPSNEDIFSKSKEFETISIAILKNMALECIYKEKHRLLHPYKLLNQNGIWYLVADDDGVLKNFSFTKISNIKLLANTLFKPNNEFIKTIQKNEATWFSQNVIDVTLEIDMQVSEYFLRRKLLPNQTIISQSDEKLILSTQISYDNEILGIVQYWLPHIKIISPSYLQEKLIINLKKYLNTT